MTRKEALKKASAASVDFLKQTHKLASDFAKQCEFGCDVHEVYSLLLQAQELRREHDLRMNELAYSSEWNTK